MGADRLNNWDREGGRVTRDFVFPQVLGADGQGGYLHCRCWCSSWTWSPAAQHQEAEPTAIHSIRRHPESEESTKTAVLSRRLSPPPIQLNLPASPPGRWRTETKPGLGGRRWTPGCPRAAGAGPCSSLGVGTHFWRLVAETVLGPTLCKLDFLPGAVCNRGCDASFCRLRVQLCG